jgi:hypothetical protein
MHRPTVTARQDTPASVGRSLGLRLIIAGVLLATAMAILATASKPQPPLGAGQHVPLSGQTTTAPTGPAPGDLEGDLGRVTSNTIHAVQSGYAPVGSR